MSAELALKALEEGRYGDAVRGYEALADEGVVHAALSFNRGLAYAGKLSLAQRDAGDFGQAVAAFTEAERLAQTPDTVAAARKMLSTLADSSHAAPTITHMRSWDVVPTVSERTLWTAALGLGIVLATLAVIVRVRAFSARQKRAFGTAAFAASVLWLGTASLIGLKRYDASLGAPAVVVHTFTAHGQTVPEGSTVRLMSRDGAQAIIETEDEVLETNSAFLRVLQAR